MWNKLSQTVVTDMLFNLLLAFIALFYITFVMVSITKKKEDQDTKNDNNILITMRWKTNNDIDLWLKLPDGRKVWYSNRDEPPAHLDVDVVAWRHYSRNGNGAMYDNYNGSNGRGSNNGRSDYPIPSSPSSDVGNDYIIETNEEIMTIRDVLDGEYAINAHYYSARDIDPNLPIEVEIIVQDVKNSKILYAGTKSLNMMQKEVHFVRFSVKSNGKSNGIETYSIEGIYTDRPTYFVGNSKPGSQAPQIQEN